LIDLGKFPETERSLPAPPLLQPLAESGLGKRRDDGTARPLPRPEQASLATMIDLGKLPEPRQTLSAPPVMQPLARADLGKKPDHDESNSPVRSEKRPAAAMFDLGKHVGSEEVAPLLPAGQPRVPSMIDFGTEPELKTIEAAPVSLLTWLSVGAGGLAVVGLLAVAAFNLHQGASRPNPDAFPVVPYAVDEEDAVSLSPTELRPLQLWSQYGDQLAALAPGSSPNDPWWKIAITARLSPAKSEAVHKLQTEVLATLDQFAEPVSDVSNGALVLIAAAKNQLKEQQTPPSLKLGSGDRGLPPPVRDLAGFFKPGDAADVP
jgi:hypothetical protein